MEAIGGATEASQVAVHPLSSVTVTVYVPAITPVMSSVVAPLLHKYVYGGVPKLAVASTPSQLPSQVTSKSQQGITSTLKMSSFVQSLASDIVNVYV